MKQRLQFFLSIILSFYLGISCNAPRTNPLDPLNPDYNYGIIEGSVQSIGNPSFAIDDVQVLWVNANLITQTNAFGRFRLINIPIENGIIIFSKAGFKSDTLAVVWGNSKSFISLTFLNRIPTLDSVSIYTIVKNDYSPFPTSELFVKAWITDLDDDVDTVFVTNETLNLRKPLVFQQTEGNYQTTLTENELNINDIEETIGLDFFIVTKDRLNEFIIGSDRITRVIKNEVTGMHPSTDSTVIDSTQPVIFKWNEFKPGYYFTYLIELYSYSFPNSQLIHTKENIPGDSTSYTLPQILTIGDYYWVIWIVDQFQNRSRSKQVAFKIRPPG